MSYGQNTRTMSSFSRPVEIGKEYTVDITDAGKAGLVIFIKKYKSRGQKYKD